MKQELQLYINGKEIHFEESPQILFTFQQTDLTDPAAVKNSFTKTVTFSGTPENNQVFNSIYDLRRIQSYDEGYFNASQRIPFELYKGGELIEDGYAKLDSISKDNGEIKYNVTLYGGLGDFFYNLTYNEDGEKMQLADLAYTDSADPDDELSFILNKDAIYDAWNYLKNDTDEHKWGIINFMPAYNGIPKDFDANKILVNKSGYIAEVRVTDGTTITTQNGFPETIGSYSTVNGYGLAETPQPMTEWDIRDLRSYLQRPCLRIKKLIEAICNPKNNGGYTVNLDKAFFDGNPYFNDA